MGDEHWQAAIRACPDGAEAYKQALAAAGEEIYADYKGTRHVFKVSGTVLLIRLQGVWRIYVPSCPTIKQQLLWQHHDHPTAGHVGIKKTYDNLSRIFYWQGMYAYTEEYVQTCTRCRASKSLSQKPAGLLQPLSIPTRRWATVSLNFITGLPLSRQGHDAILTMVDALSKMAHFIPTTTTASAEDVVHLLPTDLCVIMGSQPNW